MTKQRQCLRRQNPRMCIGWPRPHQNSVGHLQTILFGLRPSIMYNPKGLPNNSSGIVIFLQVCAAMCSQKTEMKLVSTQKLPATRCSKLPHLDDSLRTFDLVRNRYNLLFRTCMRV